MNEQYLTSILNTTEQCCQLLLCSACNTLPREIVSLTGQDAILCLSCAERQYASGKIAHLSMIHSNIKFNKVLGLLNRTFRTLYELNDLPLDSHEHIDEKKEAIKEGVFTCLALLRPSIREHNQKTPTIEPKKKKIIIKKKNFDILNDESDNENDKENQSMTPTLTEESLRRTTVRGSNPSKRSASSKQQENDENESPSKRSKKADDIDAPLPIISPAVTKKTTPTRKKASNDGDEKKTSSIRFTRKVSSKTDEQTTSENVEKSKKDEINTSTEEKSQLAKKKPALTTKSSIDVRNDKGESLIHQAVKKGDVTRVKQLIDDGLSVNTVDNNSWTPLHEAASMDNIPLMELLLSNNANINIPGGHEKMTVLHEAILNDNPKEKTIKFLLENGADPQIKNKNGQTASDLALASKNAQLVSLFQNIQCKHPSHNDLPVVPPVRRRVRTTSATNILFFTGFDKARKESLMKSAQSIFGRKAVSSTKNVENNVTHVIACGETDRIAFRTINYLRGIVLGKWLLTEKWIEECIKQKQWIDEKDFEMLGSQLEPHSNGCQTSRIKHEQNESLIFDKCQFFLYGQFHTYKKEDLADLVKITGATLLKREPKLHRIDSESDMNNSNPLPIMYIIYESSIPDVLLDNNRIKHIKLLDFLACVDYYDTAGRLDQ